MDQRHPLLHHRAFVRFWIADGVSMAGSAITGFALQVLAVITLRATGTEIGVLNAARWLPYPVFGLLAGVLVDRVRRRPILIGTDLARAVVLGLIPLSAALGVLSFPVLVCVVFVFGALSVASDAAHQSYVPALLPKSMLTVGYARLEQTSAVAQTGGPVMAGALIRLIGAPLAILVDAISYLVSAALLTTVRSPEPAPDRSRPRDLRAELREGLAWVYRHRTLGPLAVTSHLWFLCQGMVTTVYVVFVLQTLDMDAFQLGLTYALAGVGVVTGTSLSTPIGRRYGVGRPIIVCRWLTPFAFLLIPLAGPDTVGLTVLCLAQFLFGLSVGVDSPIEMGYLQGITPSGLLGRMNATMRSVNRSAIVIGAPVGGLLADHLGNRPALWIGGGGMVLQAAALNLSPFRQARLPDAGGR
jgi:MFS family permease